MGVLRWKLADSCWQVSVGAAPVRFPPCLHRCPTPYAIFQIRSILFNVFCVSKLVHVCSSPCPGRNVAEPGSWFPGTNGTMVPSTLHHTPSCVRSTSTTSWSHSVPVLRYWTTRNSPLRILFLHARLPHAGPPQEGEAEDRWSAEDQRL